MLVRIWCKGFAKDSIRSVTTRGGLDELKGGLRWLVSPRETDEVRRFLGRYT